jgi:hypothetical protein
MEQYAKRLHEILEEKNNVSYSVMNDTNQLQVVHNGDICAQMTVDGRTMNIDQLSNCHIPRGGTIHLEALLQLAEENPIDSVRLHDASYIRYSFRDGKQIDLNLRHLNMLVHGTSWYGKYGFHDQDTLRFHEKIVECIQLSLVDLLEEYVYLPIVSAIKQELYSLFQTEVSQPMTIQNVIQNIIGIIKEDCPRNQCKNKVYDFLFTTNQLIEHLFSLVMTYITPTDMGLFVEKRITPSPAPVQSVHVYRGRSRDRGMSRKHRSRSRDRKRK